MEEVKYSVNGKYFKDFEVYISDSFGIADGLQRKKVNTYDWAEYNGISIDLSNPKFEARELKLNGFVLGDDWDKMVENFNTILFEFEKSGTQRLMIEPFSLKPRVYEVFIEGTTELVKRFKSGKMIGLFTLNLTEPNPIKKVFVTNLDAFNLSYSSNSETEVFWGDGTKNTFSGNVTEKKDFHFPSYQSSGYSLAYQSAENPLYYQTDAFISALKYYEFSVQVNELGGVILYVIGRNKITNVYELITQSIAVPEARNLIKSVAKVDLSKYGKIFFKVLSNDGLTEFGMTNPRIELTEILGEWQDMSGKTKYIIIAGSINELSNVATDADELWTKL